jgi:hypothetical protein
MAIISILVTVLIAILLPMGVSAGIIPESVALFLEKNALWIGLGTLVVAAGGALKARKSRKDS